METRGSEWVRIDSDPEGRGRSGPAMSRNLQLFLSVGVHGMGRAFYLCGAK